jgi:uncharacterized repeat protein (TIGR01451 family)
MLEGVQRIQGMSLKAFSRLVFGVWLVVAAAAARSYADEEVHHATQLGFPSTRFAPPRTSPESVRELFLDFKLRPDFAMVLHRVDWKGDLDDFFRAGLNAKVVEWEIPIGGKMPFMSTRENHVPIALRNVIWEGKAPVKAYAFEFVSKGKRYRCVIPRPCSNFFVEDLGEAAPKLELVKTEPADVDLCDHSVPVTLTVRNTGNAPATDVQVIDTLPAGWQAPGSSRSAGVPASSDTQVADGLQLGSPRQGVGEEVYFKAGTLQAGQERQFKFVAGFPGKGVYTNTARAKSAEGATAEALAITTVHAPAVTWICTAPAKMVAGRAFKVYLTAGNNGDGNMAKGQIILPIPADVTVGDITEGGAVNNDHIEWFFENLAAGASKTVCVSFTGTNLTTVNFTALISGSCAKPVQTHCSTRIVGVPAVLLELVDLEDPVQVGDPVHYVVTVKNQGFGPLTHVKLLCRVPESQQFVEATGPTGTTLVDGVLTMDTIESMPPHATSVWKVTMKALKDDDVRFKVELQADQYEKPIHEDESTRQY